MCFFFFFFGVSSLQSKPGERREAMAPAFTSGNKVALLSWQLGYGADRGEELQLPLASHSLVGTGCAEGLPKKCHPLCVPASSLHLGGCCSALGYSQRKVASGASRFQAVNPAQRAAFTHRLEGNTAVIETYYKVCSIYPKSLYGLLLKHTHYFVSC